MKPVPNYAETSKEDPKIDRKLIIPHLPQKIKSVAKQVNAAKFNFHVPSVQSFYAKQGDNLTRSYSSLVFYPETGADPNLNSYLKNKKSLVDYKNAHTVRFLVEEEESDEEEEDEANRVASVGMDVEDNILKSNKSSKKHDFFYLTEHPDQFETNDNLKKDDNFELINLEPNSETNQLPNLKNVNSEKYSENIKIPDFSPSPVHSKQETESHTSLKKSQKERADSAASFSAASTSATSYANNYTSNFTGGSTNKDAMSLVLDNFLQNSESKQSPTQAFSPSHRISPTGKAPRKNSSGDSLVITRPISKEDSNFVKKLRNCHDNSTMDESPRKRQKRSGSFTDEANIGLVWQDSNQQSSTSQNFDMSFDISNNASGLTLAQNFSALNSSSSSSTGLLQLPTIKKNNISQNSMFSSTMRSPNSQVSQLRSPASSSRVSRPSPVSGRSNNGNFSHLRARSYTSSTGHNQHVNPMTRNIRGRLNSDEFSVVDSESMMSLVDSESNMVLNMNNYANNFNSTNVNGNNNNGNTNANNPITQSPQQSLLMHDCVESELFQIQGDCFKLLVFPDGSELCKLDDHFSFYVVNNEGAFITFALFTDNVRKLFCHRFSAKFEPNSKNMWGEATFAPIPDPFVVGFEILENPARFRIDDGNVWVVENVKNKLKWCTPSDHFYSEQITQSFEEMSDNNNLFASADNLNTYIPPNILVPEDSPMTDSSVTSQRSSFGTVSAKKVKTTQFQFLVAFDKKTEKDGSIRSLRRWHEDSGSETFRERSLRD